MLVVKKEGMEKVVLQNGNKRILEDIKESLEKKWKAEGKKDGRCVEVRAMQ